MKTKTLGVAPIVVAVCVSCFSEANARDLTFEDRVQAQEAIERVYYSHQIGAAKPFEEAIPREVLEKKVRTYLKQSVALEKYWHTPVTVEMLHREVERMARGSRMPERLRELYAALGNDPFLIHECLARATLVDRLTRNFFAFDEVIHGEERRTAEALHRDLLERRIDPYSEHPERTVFDLVRSDLAKENGGSVEGRRRGEREYPPRLDLSPEEFERWEASLPRETGAIGPLTVERDAFVIRVLLERKEIELRMANFSVPKRRWQDWWGRVEGTLDESLVETLAPNVSLVSTALSGSHGESRHPLPASPTIRGTTMWNGSVMVVWGGYDSTFLALAADMTPQPTVGHRPRSRALRRHAPTTPRCGREA